jgi:hypothetical protein
MPLKYAFGLALLSAAMSCDQQAPLVRNEKAGFAGAAIHSSGTKVVELFQSQGCSSCPPANAALNRITGRSDIIALNYSVTYWDRLGWKDTFAKPIFTERQRAYAKALKGNSVYTPQVILNGRAAIVGNGPGELQSAVSNMATVARGPTISSDGASVTISAGKGSGTVWLVRYDPRIQNVAIGSGENSGRTLPHRNVVRDLKKLGEWQGKAMKAPLPHSTNANWKSVVLVQKSPVGSIFAAQRI